MEHREEYFTGGKNLQIFYQSWIPAKPKAIIQIIHGGVEHIGRYKYLINYLVSKNFGVYGNDHRGHGRSEGRRNHIMSLDEFVDDCYILTKIIQKNHNKLPIFIIGHSMGSLIGQRFAIRYNNELQGLVLSGTGTKIPPLPKVLNFIGKIMFKIKPTFKGPSGIKPEEISSDLESVEDYINDPLINYKNASVAYGFSLIRHYDEIKDKMGSITIPVLIQKGEFDKMIIDLDTLIEDLKQTNLTVRIYPEGKHEMYNEKKEKRETAFSDLINWLEKQL